MTHNEPALQGVARPQAQERKARGGARDTKKSKRYLLTPLQVRYRAVNELKEKHPIRRLCKAMDLTANSYYLFLAGKNRKREARRNRLSVLISSRFRESNKTYGPVRIHKDLKAESVRCSRGYMPS